MNRSGASGVRLRRSWAAVLGAVPATVPAKPAVDRAVQMAAEDALDLRIAGDDRDIGQRVEPVDLGDRARQEFGGIEPAVEQLARCEDVRIGQLDGEHWLLQVI
jgi:hypothetical protein